MNPTARFIPIWLLLVLAATAVAPASGRDKHDLVILKNGDHITCEIKSLARGMLTVKTDSAGKLQVANGKLSIISQELENLL